MIRILRGAAPEPNLREAARYAGVKGDPAQILPLLEDCKKELLPALSPVACYDIFDICAGESLDLGFAKVKSRALCKNLAGCKKIALFAATVGAGADRVILKYRALSPSRALFLDALASAAAESWCDEVNAEIVAQFKGGRPRFSCGYGDLDISLQRDIFAALSVTKNIGVTLSDDCFMTPVKSVTAIIGLYDD